MDKAIDTGHGNGCGLERDTGTGHVHRHGQEHEPYHWPWTWTQTWKKITKMQTGILYICLLQDSPGIAKKFF
jgi:hypothetical protein